MSSTLKKSNLISQEEKEILQNISMGTKDEVVAVLLRSLKNKGKFEAPRGLLVSK